MAEAKELQGIFIDVEIDDAIAGDAEIAAKLEEVCPVDIFVEAAPPGGVVVKKLYDGTELRR
jgi:hypothetical protein